MDRRAALQEGGTGVATATTLFVRLLAVRDHVGSTSTRQRPITGRFATLLALYTSPPPPPRVLIAVDGAIEAS